MVVREIEALPSPFSEESEPLSWIPEILRERGLVTTLEEYQGNSPRLQGLQLVNERRPEIRRKHGLDSPQPRMVVLQDALFRTFVEARFAFPEEVERGLVALIQQSIERSETKMLSVRRAYWTPENPDPLGPPFNALTTSKEVLKAIRIHYKNAIKQDWHKRPEVEVSLNLQEFTDPPDVQIENGELVGDVVPVGGEVTPLSPKRYRVDVVPGDNRGAIIIKTDTITIETNGRGFVITDFTTAFKPIGVRDRDGVLIPFKLPTKMHVGFSLLNHVDALRLACIAHELQEYTGTPYRIEFSAGTRDGHPVVFVNEALPYERPPSLEVRREPQILKGRVFATIQSAEDIQALKGRHPKRGEKAIVFIDPLFSTDTTRLHLGLSRLATLNRRREEPFISLYPGTETEHRFRLLARELGLKGFPVVQGRRFRPGDRVLIRSDGVEHMVTNLTLAGNKHGLCLQEYSEPPTSLEIGNKAEGLKTLLSLGLPVPPVFVLTRDFFLSTLWKNKMLARWGHLKDANTPEELEEKFEELREGLRVLPTGHWREFLRLLRFHLASDTKLIVRSSSNVEDLATRSFTGEFETAADVDFTNLEDAVLRVMRSPFTDKFVHSIWPPRPRKGLDPDEGRRTVGSLAMPVIVMPQVESEVSGTLWHCDPVTGSPSIITIEAQPGKGGVVGGERREKTLNIKFNAQTGEVLSITMIEGGVVRRPKSLTTREETLLTNDEAEALYRSAGLIHRKTGEYHDTEWGIGALPGVLLDGGLSDHRSQLWFFQTRPVQVTGAG